MNTSALLRIANGSKKAPAPPQSATVCISRPDSLLYFRQPTSNVFLIRFRNSSSVSGVSNSPIIPAPACCQEFWSG